MSYSTKTYLLAIALLAFFAVSVGFVLPALFSAASTEAVIVAFAYLFLVMPFAIRWVYKTWQKLPRPEPTP